MVRPTNDRIVGVLVIGLGLLGLLWIRCVWLQVLGAHRYASFAVSQHQSAQMLRARRGTIVDRAGRPLAISLPTPSVFANARQVEAKRDVARQLAGLVDRDPRMIQRSLEKD